MHPSQELLLRRLAVNDEAAIESVLRMSVSDVAASGLDARTYALARVACLIALQPSGTSLEWSVAAAFAAGSTEDEVVGVLISVAPVVGVARLNQASAAIATALGYDIDLPDEPHRFR